MNDGAFHIAKLFIPNKNLTMEHPAQTFLFNSTLFETLIKLTLNPDRLIQKLMFPKGLVIDRKKWQYLTKEMNLLFAVKSFVMGNKGDKNKKTPHQNDEESCVVVRHLTETRTDVRRLTDMSPMSYSYFSEIKFLMKYLRQALCKGSMKHQDGSLVFIPKDKGSKELLPLIIHVLNEWIAIGEN